MIGAAIISATAAALLTGGLAASPVAGQYDCTLSSRWNAGVGSRTFSGADGAKIGLSFGLQVADLSGSDDLEMDIAWNGNPFQLQGARRAIWAREGGAWLANGRYCEGDSGPRVDFVSLKRGEDGEIDLSIMPLCASDAWPQAWVGEDLQATCKRSENS